METRTLVLNSWGLPHAVVSWEEAICLVYQDKATTLEEYDETVSSPSVAYFIPAVLQLREAVKPFKKGVKFSRINVFTRDGFRCQYCGGRFMMRQLNYDHVIPRKQGGTTSWENIVTSCYPCNDRKGARTPDQAGMTLLRRPARPNSLPLHPVFISAVAVPEAWKPYLDFSKAHRHGEGYYMVSSAA